MNPILAAALGLSSLLLLGASQSSIDPETRHVVERAIRALHDVDNYYAEGPEYLWVKDERGQRSSRWNQVTAVKGKDWYWNSRIGNADSEARLKDGSYDYSYTTHLPKYVAQSRLDEERRRDNGKVSTVLSDLEDGLRDILGYATVVRRRGEELVQGELCDVIEFKIQIDPKQWAKAKEGAADVPDKGYLTEVYYMAVDDGLPRRYTTATTIPNVSAEYREYNYTRKPFPQPGNIFMREHLMATIKGIVGDGPQPKIVSQLAEPGEHLPPVNATLLDGTPLRWENFRGKILVVETFASWCGSCKQMMPYYEQQRRKLAAAPRAPQVVFLALNFDADIDDYERWLEKNHTKYGFLFARARVDKTNWLEVLRDFKGSLPAFYVVGEDGRIVSRYTGAIGDKAGDEDTRLTAALRKAGVQL